MTDLSYRTDGTALPRVFLCDGNGRMLISFERRVEDIRHSMSDYPFAQSTFVIDARVVAAAASSNMLC